MSEVEPLIRKWLDEFVVGYGLCPFAAEPLRKGRVGIRVSDASEFDDAVRLVLDELDHLIDNATVSTTLCVFESALGDFDEFLDACDVVNALLEESGADDFAQIAHFHPDYRFADVEPDEPSNYTNRAPFPVIQLLRVEEVAQAVAAHPDIESVPAENVKRFRDLGDEVIRHYRSLEPGSG